MTSIDQGHERSHNFDAGSVTDRHGWTFIAVNRFQLRACTSQPEPPLVQIQRVRVRVCESMWNFYDPCL